MQISSGEQLRHQDGDTPEKYCNHSSSTHRKSDDLKEPDVTQVVDSSVYAGVLDYNGARIFVKRSAITASMTAKVGSHQFVL